MSQPTDSACPTKQQLDELEALMQRMLSLPVSEGEEALPAPPEAKSRPATLPPRLRAIPDPPPWDDPAPAATVPPPPPAHVPSPPAPRSPARPVAPPPSVVISERVRVEEYPVMPELPAAPAEAASPAPAAAEPPAPRTKPRVVRRLSTVAGEPQELWWLMPLVWGNHAFDRCTIHMGRSGRWLRGTRGRNWIGWSGVLLLALAMTWALVEWLGWAW